MENLELAIKAYQAALTVRTREALPQDWAGTQNNLGVVYSDRIRGDRAENLELAIKAFEAALTVFTREALPQDWAQTQNKYGAFVGGGPAGETRLARRWRGLRRSARGLSGSVFRPGA